MLDFVCYIFIYLKNNISNIYLKAEMVVCGFNHSLQESERSGFRSFLAAT